MMCPRCASPHAPGQIICRRGKRPSPEHERASQRLTARNAEAARRDALGIDEHLAELRRENRDERVAYAIRRTR